MFIVSYYTKKISPLYAQTNLSISVLIFGKSYYSQTVTYFFDVDISFRHLQNYTTLKQVRIMQDDNLGLRHLQNYTTLKQHYERIIQSNGLRHLQNYTTLKQRLCFIFCVQFEAFTELDYSQIK